MSIINPSQLDSLIEVNGNKGFNPTERGGGGVIWYTDGSKIKKEVGCVWSPPLFLT
jgi:hypothetical protein